ncbi:MAG: lytic transglycosylase domain-containing protein [Flavobacteriales bacterium]
MTPTQPSRTPRLLIRTGLWSLLLLGAALSVHLFTYSSTVENSDADHQRHFNDNYKVFSLTLPNDLELFGQPVPLERLDVRERLDRELLVNTYWQSNTVLLHKRANRWFPMVAAVLAKAGVPEDMKYIPVVESGFTNVVSPAGAAGPWQFMKATATAYGLEVSDEVDERYHMEKSTEAAARYLKRSYEQYGDWALAAASYNLGPEGVARQLDQQGVNGYFNLQLPEETARYVFRILAMKEIMRDPERYGFHLRERDLYMPYRTRSVMVNGPIPDLAAFAREQGTDYRSLKLLNPWLRSTKLSNAQRRSYTLLLPAEDFDAVVTSNDE